MWPAILHLDLPFWPYEFSIRSYGLMLMIGFLGGIWWARRRAGRVKANPELVVDCGFIALAASLVGARAFYVIHYWERFEGRGLWAVLNITAGGLEFYGGFLAAVTGILVYLWWRRASLRLYLDIVAPSVAFGLAVTRIGCFLNGCCWGGPCPEQIPWRVHFPYESPAFEEQWHGRTVALPAELIYVSPTGCLAYPVEAGEEAGSDDPVTVQAHAFGLTRQQLVDEMPRHRSASLHPAQLYSSIDAALLAVVLSTVFHRRQRHGTIFALLILLYPVMRFFEEIIRMDNPHDTAGLTISQFLSVLILASGIAFLLMIRRLPQRSPRAVPYMKPLEQTGILKREPRHRKRRASAL